MNERGSSRRRCEREREGHGLSAPLSHPRFDEERVAEVMVVDRVARELEPRGERPRDHGGEQVANPRRGALIGRLEARVLRRGVQGDVRELEGPRRSWKVVEGRGMSPFEGC